MDNDNKKIIFSGINTKYQIKKVVGTNNKVPKIRSMWTDSSFNIDEPSQLQSIIDISNNDMYLKEISNKLNGYKNQDILKTRYDISSFITITQAVELLVACELKCFYCNVYTPILYKNVRDGTQWTLDRINNDIGHSFSNVVISCLKCNLQRKRMSATAFAMSKQMIISRV